ncbi:AAA family ATPase [Pseudomonas sp. 2FG]|uniref:AAA family ATPase n=1 Tax=Pseudomonas sp. 2FG TaxID=2502191 RepID=UPI0010F4F40A|nr:AAA family ATPase [Pseudomonas sp. 2FG]
MKFKSLTIDSWKQFEEVSIHFHPSVTILTGANGSGKTTVLSLLGRHFGWAKVELATPTKNKETGKFQWLSRLFGRKDVTDLKIGEITHDKGKSDLLIPQQDGPQYHVQITNQISFPGINIPSHRPIYSYQQVPHISTQKRTKHDAYSLVMQSSLQRHNNGHSQSSNFFIKETLLSWAIGGSGNEFIAADKELHEHFIGFESVLKKVLPDTIGFRKIAIRSYEVILETDSGDFMLDAVSGGVSAVIDLAWQIYNCQRDESGSLVVLIDEIENHLHPSMQRRILPDLASAFPNVQFIVSTHSPLVVGSARESKVYAFTYDDNKRVISQELDLINKAKTASQVLNDVLGVPVTMPIWAEAELDRVLVKHKHIQNPETQFANIRSELSACGLGDYFPDAIVKLSRDWK